METTQFTLNVPMGASKEIESPPWYDQPWANLIFKFIERHAPLILILQIIALIIFLAILFHIPNALADSVRLPGEDISAQMESAGTLLRFVDTGIFQWTARVLAGLCIFGAGWSLKEMRFGPAVIGIVAAILFGTAPTWVKNIFSIGGSNSVFSMVSPDQPKSRETGNA